MGTSRTITVRLTEAQFKAIASAVAIAGTEYADMDSPYFDRASETTDRAWSKIRRAWHDKGRR